MDWAHKMLLSVSDDFVDQFRSIGIVEALASIFKVCMCLIFNFQIFSTCGGYIFSFRPEVYLFHFSLNRSFLHTRLFFVVINREWDVSILVSQLHTANLV
jgi:hypothetical protein